MDHRDPARSKKNYPYSDIAALLSNVDWAIMNFDRKFSGSSANILFLSPAFSSMIGVEVIDKQFCIGVPTKLFEKMWRIHWRCAVTIEKDPGVFLAFATHQSPPNHFGMIRLYLRPRLAHASRLVEEIVVCRMADDGTNMAWDANSSFSLPIKKLKRPDWERKK